MANFKLEKDNILRAEGGYTDHKDDRGGATNLGITIGVLSRWRGKKVSKTDVKNLTIYEAMSIYKAWYWDKVRLDEVDSQLVASVFFDQAVNRGYVRAAKLMQKACNVFNKRLKEDGVVGKKTLGAINSIEDDELAMEFIQLCQKSYVDIVLRNKSQIVFLKGWLNRTHYLLDMILDVGIKDPGKVHKPEKGIIDTIKESLLPNKDVINKDVQDVVNKVLKENPDIKPKALSAAMSFYTHKSIKNKDVITLADYTMPSKSKRLFQIDMNTGEVEKYLCAHGKKSDPDYDGMVDMVSNIVGSNMSSSGAAVTYKTYMSSKFGYALRLKGLEKGINDNIFRRAMVVHAGKYVNEYWVKTYGKVGRTLGCWGLNPKYYKKIINKAGIGSLWYTYYE